MVLGIMVPSVALDFAKFLIFKFAGNLIDTSQYICVYNDVLKTANFLAKSGNCPDYRKINKDAFVK